MPNLRLLAVNRIGGWTTAAGFRVVHVPPKKDAADLALSLDALGQQRAKAMGIFKAEAGIGKSASWSDWFRNILERLVQKAAATLRNGRARNTVPRPSEARARLKPVKQA